MDPLEDIRARLDRSEKHLDALDEAIGAYFNDEPYRFVGEEHTDGEWRHQLFLLVAIALPPDEIWGPLIGDAVHNLRSALDHLAWQLALPEARENAPRRIEFPIFLDDPESNPEVERLLAKKIGRLRPEARAIIESAQPYKAGDSHHPLWLLQALWNTDKHRVLHTAGFLYAEPRHVDPDSTWGYTGWSWGPFDRSEGWPDRLVEGAENRTQLGSVSERIENTRAAPTLQDRVDAYKDFAVDVSLGGMSFGASRDEPYVGLPVRQMLRRIERHVVEEVVPSLEHLL